MKLSSEAEKLAEEFLNLSYNQINWRADDSQWSIGECFEHLIRTNMKYIPAYEKYKSNISEEKEIDFKFTLTGKFIRKSVMPDNKRKYKTSPPFNPIGSNIKGSIIKDFIAQNNNIAKLVSAIDSSKLRKKITSPFSKFVKYNIGDSFLIVGYHNLRHLEQAKRVMEKESFPST